MGHHDLAVPIRFLALVGHFFSALLTLFAIKDNCIVALPFLYEQSDLDSLVGYARAALVLCFCVLAVNAVSFFGGFSTFDLPISIFRVPDNLERLQLCQRIGIDRVVFSLPAEKEDKILPILDRWAGLKRQLEG